MKKALFVIAALALCMTANAKYWFSGTISYDNKSFYDSDKNKGALVIAPSIGMAIEDALELGVELNISDYKNIYAGQDQRFGFSFAPFLRYTFLTEGNFNMFVQGRFEYGVVSPSGNDLWFLSCKVQPGIRYMMSDHFSAVAVMDGFYFIHRNDPAMKVGDDFKNNIGFGINCAALKLGLVYEF